MPQFQITDQDYAILALISKGEAYKPDPYNSVWPNTGVKGIKESTLDQVRNFQQQRLNAGYKSSAVGKYQFVSGTLEELINYTGVSRSTIFSPDFQDWLIIQRLYQVRKYKQWQEGTCTYKHITDNDMAFHIRLCQEIASLPLPVNIDGKRAGESYYEGKLNTTNGHNGPDEVYRELQRIRGLGPGEIQSLPIQTGQGVSAGLTAYDQARIKYGGGQTLYGASAGSRNATVVSSELPTADSPYVYEPIDPEDTRYDFRTGKKIVDLMVFGTGAASSVVYGAPSSDIGYDGFGDCVPSGAATSSPDRPVTVGYDEGEVDPGLAAAAGIATTSDPAVTNTITTTPLVIPQNAKVSEEATEEDAIDLDAYTLMGVYGSSKDRRALVRTPDDKYTKVYPGDSIDPEKPDSPKVKQIYDDYIELDNGEKLSLPPDEKSENDDSRLNQVDPGVEDREKYLADLTYQVEELAALSGYTIYEPRVADDTESLIAVRKLELQTLSV